jgi:2'-5' RNA ligase
MRLFFALWPDAATRAALAAWQPALQQTCGGRAVHAEGLHVTLAFLGEVEAGRLEALQLAAQEVSAAPFAVTLDRAQYWAHNHIVHAAAAQEPAALLQLAHDLQQNLLRHEFRLDARNFQTHVTLLRKAACRSALPALPPLRWQLHDFVLVRSVLDAHGSRYEVLARFPLK